MIAVTIVHPPSPDGQPPTPYYIDPTVTVHHGDCLDVLRSLPDASVDAVATDPPYGLGFMGREWDALPPGVPFAAECLRVLKPGGHMLAFGGTRTWHRLACAVEDAGFEIRDSIAWMYATGFPKSLNVSKAIDKAAGAERTVVGRGLPMTSLGVMHDDDWKSDPAYNITAPATPDAERWQGWGTALKPAHEPVLCARKPDDSRGILAKIGSQLDALEDACRQRVNGAAKHSAPTRHASPAEMTATAPGSAATQHEGEPAKRTPTGAAAGSSAATATSAFEWTGETFLSTVTSWKACWAELWEATNTSTTSTTTSRTTDLTTLSSCLSQIMQRATARSTLEPASWWSLVTVADNLFGAGVLSLRSTLALSAIESATSATPPTSPDAVGSSPAFEPIVVARKPLAGTVAANVLAHGTGALNVDGCRVGVSGADLEAMRGRSGASTPNQIWGAGIGHERTWEPTTAGRWPANVILDESQAEVLDEQSGESQARIGKPRGADSGDGWGMTATGAEYDDLGGASRFYYVAKADASERVRVDGIAHPTVKPLALMRWLVRLVTPPGGTVLEPFAGSGTTVEACILEGFRCIAIEREADYLPLIKQRIHRRRDPVEAVKAAGEDGGLFDLLDGGAA